MKNKFLLFFSVLFLTLTHLWGQDTYTQITNLAELTNGDYLVVGDGSSNDGIMLNQTNAPGDATYILHTAISNPGTEISTGFTTDNVFTIQLDADQITLFNATVGYVTYRASGNNASFFNGTPTNSEKWTFSVTDGLWTLTNVNSSTRIFQWNNSSPRFAAYTTNQVKLKLYKKQSSEPTGYTIAVTQPEGGSISPEGIIEVEEGGNAEFTATADECFTFSHWVVDDANAGNTNPYVFSNVTADHTITAVFNANSYTVSAAAGPNGTITPNGDVEVNCGENQIFTIAADAGFEIEDVLVDEVSVGAVAEYTFTEVTENHTISVSFAEITEPGEVCGTEDFESTEISSTYSDGEFTNNGITWTYGHSRNEGLGTGDDYSIEGKGLMLRRASDSYLETTLSDVGEFTFEYRKAFTGGNDRQLEIIVNGTQVATTPVFGSGSGADATVHTITIPLNIEGEAVIRIKNVGEETANRQTTLDNISWTCLDTEPCDVPAPIAIGTFEFVAGETLADLEDSLEFTGELTWYDDEELTIVLPDTTLLVDAGVYYVTQTVDGCESEALRVETDELGLDSNELANFRFYPNPVKDVLRISNTSKIQKVEIYNLNGNLVWTKSIQGNQAALNLESLSSGVYVMKVTTEKETKSVKILKK